MKKLLLVGAALLSLAGCREELNDENSEHMIHTVRHDGLCFVAMYRYRSGLAMVQVDCAALKSSQEVN